MLVLKCFPLQVFINLTTPKGCDPDLNPAQDPEKKVVLRIDNTLL